MIVNKKRNVKLSDPCHLLATGFGVGMFPWMPGTVGSFVAVILWNILILLPKYFYLLILIFSICLGIYFCHKTSNDIGFHDHACIVWDEFVGIWIALTIISDTNYYWMLAIFLLFRIFDIYKPWPISWLDNKIKGGIGIMIDDIAVSIITATTIYCIKYIIYYFK